MKKIFQLGIAGVSAALLLTGCQFAQAGDTKSEKEVVERDKANSLSVDIELGVGQLNVSKGAENWFEGEFNYDHTKLKPVVDYNFNGSQGDLHISQERKKFNFGFGKENHTRWDLLLNEDIPTELDVDTGVSDSELNLSGMRLEDLDINTGVGDVTIDLSGAWDESFNVSIDSGVGNTTIYIPKEVGVKLSADKGVGDINVKDLIVKGDHTYVNEAYEKGAEVVIEIDADLGVGDIEVLMK
ncbi:toast rack family protein [Halobacillus mangrovi]|uniref:toast rack family protein n=1 Tax=Halobacillus mangrovi TaxID=402384 RepID=UPI003D972E86